MPEPSCQHAEAVVLVGVGLSVVGHLLGQHVKGRVAAVQQHVLAVGGLARVAAVVPLARSQLARQLDAAAAVTQEGVLGGGLDGQRER